MAREQGKPGALERGANFFERLNKFVGGVAIVGAVGAAAAGRPELAAGLATVAVFQFLENEIIWKSFKKNRAPA